MFNNVGFQLWHMSLRISAVKRLARETAELVSEAESSWSGGDLAELRTIAETAGLLATQADQAWSRLHEVAHSFDPGLTEPTESGVVIVHNRGDNAGAAAAVGEVWREMTCVDDAQRVALRADDLLVRLGMEPRHIMGTMAAPAQ
jgi:hypothetical protein